MFVEFCVLCICGVCCCVFVVICGVCCVFVVFVVQVAMWGKRRGRGAGVTMCGEGTWRAYISKLWQNMNRDPATWRGHLDGSELAVCIVEVWGKWELAVCISVGWWCVRCVRGVFCVYLGVSEVCKPSCESLGYVWGVYTLGMLCQHVLVSEALTASTLKFLFAHRVCFGL